MRQGTLRSSPAPAFDRVDCETALGVAVERNFFLCGFLSNFRCSPSKSFRRSVRALGECMKTRVCATVGTQNRLGSKGKSIAVARYVEGVITNFAVVDKGFEVPMLRRCWNRHAWLVQWQQRRTTKKYEERFGCRVFLFRIRRCGCKKTGKKASLLLVVLIVRAPFSCACFNSVRRR